MGRWVIRIDNGSTSLDDMVDVGFALVAVVYFLAIKDLFKLFNSLRE